MSDETEAIVRALAASDPRVDSEGAPDCGLCHLMLAGDRDLKEHQTDCPWRRAVEWVDGHPA